MSVNVGKACAMYKNGHLIMTYRIGDEKVLDVSVSPPKPLSKTEINTLIAYLRLEREMLQREEDQEAQEATKHD